MRDVDRWVKEINSLVTPSNIVLDVGCGQYKTRASFIGVDAYAENVNVNVKAFMWDMPFGDQTIDGIVCRQAMEHISKYQVLPTLAEFDRVLKVGGTALIMVPDLVWVMRAFMKNPNYGWEMDMIFGSQTEEGQYHKTGFTKEILYKYFEQFPNFPIKHIYRVYDYNQYNLSVVARRES